jgi:hypothetical protein
MDAVQYREKSLARSRNRTLAVQLAAHLYAASRGKLKFATLLSGVWESEGKAPPVLYPPPEKGPKTCVSVSSITCRQNLASSLGVLGANLSVRFTGTHVR